MNFRRPYSFVLFACFALANAAATSPGTSEKVTQLLEQPEGLAQLSQLSAADLKFDFTTQPTYTFQPGGVINANTDSFPVRRSSILLQFTPKSSQWH